MPGHDHAAHGHAPASYGRAFAVGIALNLGFVAAEAVYGFLADSVALLADAGHNLSDVLGLALAWGAYRLAARPPSRRYTYGLRGSSILAALANGLLLFAASGAIAWEALRRLADPPAVATTTVMAVAGVGIAINLATALMFAGGRRHDINIRGAYLHMAADAAVSAGVVVAGAVTALTGWTLADPVASLFIVAVILWSSWGLMREAVALALGAVPPGIDPDAVAAALAATPGVSDVHHLHIWATSTTDVALTAHLVMPDGGGDDALLARIAHDLEHRFGIGHSTLQVEREGRHRAKC